ncbi:SMYD2, partial [Symbiodinium sp. CCMP2456]
GHLPPHRWPRLADYDELPSILSLTELLLDITPVMVLTYRQATEAQEMLKQLLKAPEMTLQVDALEKKFADSYEKFRWKLGGLLIKEVYPLVAAHFGFNDPSEVLLPLRAIQAHGGDDLLLQTNRLELELLMRDSREAASAARRLKAMVQARGQDFQEHLEQYTNLRLLLQKALPQLVLENAPTGQAAPAAAVWRGAELFEEAVKPMEDPMTAEARLSAQLSENRAAPLLAQRAVVRLSLGLYDAALEDARAARCADAEVAALAGLGRFAEARRATQSCIAHQWLEGLELQSKGAVNVLEVLRASVPFLLPRTSDFEGPVQMAAVAPERRGLVATRRLQAGELLLSSRSLVAVGRLKLGHGFRNPVDVYKNAARTSKHVARLLGKILSDGSPRPASALSKLLWHAAEATASDLPEESVIQGVIATNAFKDLGSSIFPAVSMANHSCLPNALVLKCGEALLLRARRVISQGEEVCINYFDVLKPLAERQKLCQSWGFVCECPRCEDEKSIDESKFRAISILMNQLRSPLAAAPPGAAPLQVALRALEDSVAASLGSPGVKRVRAVCAGYTALYNLRAQEEGSAEAIADHLKVVEAVLPGSFSHCKLSFQYWRTCTGHFGEDCVQKFKADGTVQPFTQRPLEAAWAATSAATAHKLRYGDPGVDFLPSLVEETRKSVDSNAGEFILKIR